MSLFTILIWDSKAKWKAEDFASQGCERERERELGGKFGAFIMSNDFYRLEWIPLQAKTTCIDGATYWQSFIGFGLYWVTGICLL